ncbi:MAG: hypothetical protein ACJ763_20265 [Bdellovibrionia bacterium]
MHKTHWLRIASFASTVLVFGFVPLNSALAGALAADELESQMDQELLLNSLRGARAVQDSVGGLAASSTAPCAAELEHPRASDLVNADQVPFIGKGALYMSRGGHAYAVFGGGRASEGGSLQNRALELEFGTNISSRFRVDVAHINEGHPINNHRDGFAAKAIYVMPINEKARIELGGGPYISMNTTTPNGRTINDQKDEKRLGVVGTAAVLYRLTQSGLYARAQLNHVNMPGGPSTNAILVGLGKDFNGPELASDFENFDTKKLQAAGWIGKTKTNRANAGGTMTGGQIEVSKEMSPSLAYSVSLVDEGNGPKVNRKGVATQAWYIKPVEDGLSFRAGVGPYLAENHVPDDHHVSTNAMVSLVVEKKIGKQTSISGRFNRVMSTNNRDEDMFMIGLRRDF